MTFLFSRLVTLSIFMGTGAGIACLFNQTILSACLGIGLSILSWLAWESWHILRLLNWLRNAQENPETTLQYSSGIWRETAERIYRLLRRQSHLRQENENRLQNFQAALQASPNGVIVLNQQGYIEWINQTACQHFGLDAHRDIAQSVTHLLRDPEFVAYLAERNFEQSVVLNSPVSTAAHPLRLSVRIYPYGRGQLLLLSQDITVLEQAEAIRRDFVANVSHEIRTPLTVLAGFIETLQTLSLSEDEQKDYLGRMARQAARMQNLVDDLLTLSRLESSPPPGIQEWFPVQTLLHNCEADARALSVHITGQNPAHCLTFPEMDGISGEIAGASGELQSAFFNLLSNAIRYTPPSGKIDLRWTIKQNGDALFSVQDSGPGIAPEHISRLTERFYRVDSDRSRTSGGTGLGLSIVKHVLQRHDATLHIESSLGHGACFTIEFPAFRIRNTG